MELNKELLSKAKEAKTPEELLTLAKENGTELTEAEAKEQGVAAVTGKCIMFRNGRTMIEDPGRCFMKLVADKGSHEILGAQLMCQHASDMISQISEAMVNHLTAEQMLRTMRPHPSFEEAMLEALEALTAKLQS